MSLHMLWWPFGSEPASVPPIVTCVNRLSRQSSFAKIILQQDINGNRSAILDRHAGSFRRVTKEMTSRNIKEKVMGFRTQST